jgi:hypothetical protein
MKAARWILRLVGVVLISLALACEQENPPTALARDKAAAFSASHDGVSSVEEGAADPLFTTIDVPGATFTQSTDVGPRGVMTSTCLIFLDANQVWNLRWMSM